ncbi:hypothetical protein CCP3SC1_350034 [Gammaproteobacteria bacterium]
MRIRRNDSPNVLKSSFLKITILFALVSAIILVSAYGSYLFFANEMLNHEREDLQSLGKMKAERINDLLNNCHSDTNIFIARSSVWKTLMAIDAVEEARRLTKAITNMLQSGKNYRRILVVDMAFQLVAPTISHRFEPIELSALREAVKTRDFVLVDLHRIEDGVIVYGAAHPVFANDDSNGAVVGAVYFERAAQQDLFPLLELESTSSYSLETLIARQEGNDILFLSPLRFKPDASPLSFRMSINNYQTLAGNALVRGQFGLVTGHDYHGNDVIGTTRAVPGTPWVMITKRRIQP